MSVCVINETLEEVLTTWVDPTVQDGSRTHFKDALNLVDVFCKLKKEQRNRDHLICTTLSVSYKSYD